MSINPISEKAVSVDQLIQKIQKLHHENEVLKTNNMIYHSLINVLIQGYACFRIITREDEVEDLEFLSINPAFSDLTGIRDIQGLRLNDLPMGKFVAGHDLRGRFLEVARTGVTSQFEWFSEEVNRWLSLVVYRPEPEYVISVINDIDDQKKSGLKADLIRNNYEIFFNAIDVFLIILDERGNIRHANKTVYQRLEYTPEELLGQSVLFLHPEERRDEANRIVGEMLAGKAAYCPVPLITKSGKLIPVETRVKPGVWDGKPTLFGVTKDISKLKLSEEKFSKAFYLNPCACGISDLVTGEYLEVNDAFYSLLGFSPEEVIGHTAYELGIISVEFRDSVAAQAEPGGAVHNLNASLRAKNGELKHVLLSAENIYVQDKQYRFTMVYDITELKKAEVEIRQKNEALTRSNEEKDKFFSILAHDLRNPFNSLLGFSKILEEEAFRMPPAEISRLAGNLKRSSTTLFNLLENLLEWSRMQRGAVQFNPQVCLLKKEIESAWVVVQESAAKKKINLKIDIPEKIVVTADVKMLSTVIRNLTFNAIKFTEPGGFVSVTASINDESEVEIYITDSGIGMNEIQLSKLFHLGDQVNRKGTCGETSSGLGLIICKDFMERHGGTISVVSHEGEGSTFIIRLPNP